MFEKLFFRQKKDKEPPKPKPQLEPGELEQGPALNQNVTFGNHLYRQAGDVAEVVFTHRKEKICRVLVDDGGIIQDFPGFADPEQIKRHMGSGKLPAPQVEFRTVFTRVDGDRFRMVWEVQPDGRYWEDEDGFGGTNDVEVCLYTYIDSRGRFTGPFRLYSVGVENFYNEA